MRPKTSRAEARRPRAGLHGGDGDGRGRQSAQTWATRTRRNVRCGPLGTEWAVAAPPPVFHVERRHPGPGTRRRADGFRLRMDQADAPVGRSTAISPVLVTEPGGPRLRDQALRDTRRGPESHRRRETTSSCADGRSTTTQRGQTAPGATAGPDDTTTTRRAPVTHGAGRRTGARRSQRTWGSESTTGLTITDRHSDHETSGRPRVVPPLRARRWSRHASRKASSVGGSGSTCRCRWPASCGTATGGSRRAVRWSVLDRAGAPATRRTARSGKSPTRAVAGHPSAGSPSPVASRCAAVGGRPRRTPDVVQNRMRERAARSSGRHARCRIDVHRCIMQGVRGDTR